MSIREEVRSMSKMRWRDPELLPLGKHGPLYYMAIEPGYCQSGGRFLGDFRTYYEKMLYRLENRYATLVSIRKGS